LRRQRWFGGKARSIADVQTIDEGRLDGADASIVVLAVTFADGGEERYFVPPIDDDESCRRLLDVLQRGLTIRMSRGRLTPNGGDRDTPPASPLFVRRSSVEQSNTSIVFGDELIMKVFRRIEPGLNPDVEIGRFLAARGFTRVPRLLADAEYVGATDVGGTVLLLQQFVPSQGNAWEAMLQDGDRASSMALAETLGRRTGELHETLASEPDDPGFAPERLSRADLDALAASMRVFGERQLALLRSSTLDGPARVLAGQVLEREAALLARFDDLRPIGDGGCRIRCHGDYHLGQTLVADGDVYILDFEGEPARSLAERRAKSSPLRDVAGMLRSFSYAAEAGEKGAGWEQAVAGAFMTGYRAATDRLEFLPAAGEAFDTLLDAFLLDKTLYELGYELNNRPDWVGLPLAALARVRTHA
jgi:trehalose synthase-fused probable maltokinase